METPKTIPLAYGVMPGGSVPVYQCCGTWCFQAPQAMYHVWRAHGLPFAEADARVVAVREAAALSISAPPATAPRTGTPSPETRQGVDQPRERRGYEH